MSNIRSARGVSNQNNISSIDSNDNNGNNGNNEELERAKEIKDLKRLIVIGAVLTTPVFLVGMIGMFVPGMPMWLMNPWWQAVLITPVMFYCGWPIHRVGWMAIVHRSPDMNSLVTVGAFAAYLYSLVVCIAPEALPQQSRTAYFESVGVVITLVLVGRLLEARARSGTGNAVKALIGLRPQTAVKIDNQALASGVWQRPDVDKLAGDAVNTTTANAGVNFGGKGFSEETGNTGNMGDTTSKDAARHLAVVDANSLAVGDLIVVKGGDTIPSDGIVAAGSSTIDESMITGESQPVRRGVGQQVTGATLVLDSPLVVRVNKVGKDTVLSQIIDLVSHAQATKAPVQKLADQISRIFVPIVFLIAVWTFVIWFTLGPQPRLAHAIVTAVSVLIIACPCALGLATPLSVTAGMGLGARNGILITTANALQNARRISTVVFDKTGTITKGIAHEEIKTQEGQTQADTTRTDTTRTEQAGDNHYESHYESPETSLASRVSYDNDQIKPSAPAAIARLHQMGVRTILLSGDKPETAEKIARQVGIDNVIAGVKPDGKAAWIERIQAQTQARTQTQAPAMTQAPATTQVQIPAHKNEESIQKVRDNKKALVLGKGNHDSNRYGLVAMVGDGINDAPALAQADIGFAMGTGTDIAMRSADITLMNGDLSGVVKTITLSKATMHNIAENLFFAFAYNVIGIPLAAGVLYPAFGWLLSPMIAGAAMALSSVCLVLNANRLNKADINQAEINADIKAKIRASTGKTTAALPHLYNDETHQAEQESTREEDSADADSFLDPVCGMTVGKDSISYEYQGKTYHFCSDHCLATFKENPQKFANRS